MREKTGYYDKEGKAIRDGDKIKACHGEEILIGTVQQYINEGNWCLFHPIFAYDLKNVDDIEILEDE